MSLCLTMVRPFGSDFDDDISGIKDMEVHHIMSCICHCIELIQSDNDYHLPTKLINEAMNMSIKYRIANQLATICKQVVILSLFRRFLL